MKTRTFKFNRHMDMRGYTLVELMMTLAVLSILLTIAVPSFNEVIERRRVVGAAEEIFSQLAFARMESIKRSRIIRVDFLANNTTSWSFGITDDVGANWATIGCDTAKDNATANDSCSIDEDGDATTTTDRLLYKFTHTDYPGVTMRGWTTTGGGNYRNDPSFGGSDYVTYQFTRGTATAGRVVVCTGKKELHIIVSSLGRVRICTPDEDQMPAYPQCDVPTTAGGC